MKRATALAGIVIVGALLIMTAFPRVPVLAQGQLPQELNTPYIQELARKAKAEGALLLTYGMPNDWANYGGIFADFQRLFGIREEDIDMGSSVLYARMKEENASKNDLGDVAPDFAIKLAADGLTMPYTVRTWDEIPAGQKGVGKDGSVWQAGYKGTLGWIVNTQLVRRVPKSWAELQRPEYKGMISYLDPRATGTGVITVLSAAYALTHDPYDYKAGVTYLAKLNRLGQVASVDPKVTTAKFERGEVGILINYDYNLLAWKQRFSFPTAVVIPADGTLSYGGAIVAARNAPHPNAAKLFLEFIFSKYGQSLFADGFVTPIRSDVELPAAIASKFPPKAAYKNARLVDYARVQAITKPLQQDYEATVR
jgi:putative spermidine/putrescine transport system substrate-binding protein